MKWCICLYSLAVTATWSTTGVASPYVLPECSGAPHAMTTIADAPQVVFLNFEGAKMQTGPSDSKSNTFPTLTPSPLDYPAKDWSKMGGEAVGKKAIIDQLKKYFILYNVIFVTERPTAGHYTMAMIGGTQSYTTSTGAAGVAILDCTNKNKNDVVLVFADKGSLGSSAKQIALVIAHELGHSFGLEHVTSKEAIMHPQATSYQTGWTKSAIDGASKCGRSEQDAAKILEDNLGKGKTDKITPKLWFMRPGDGAVMPSEFSFEVAAADDLGILHMVIEVDGKQLLDLNDPPFTSVLRKLSDGEHTIKATAYDYANNKAEAQIKVTVKSSCAQDGSCGGGSAGIKANCTTGGDCSSGICAVKGGAGKCVDLCDHTAEDPLCPSGLTCEKTGDQGACVPGDGYSLDTAAGDEGGCSVASASPSLAWLTLLAALALLALARRRTRE